MIKYPCDLFFSNKKLKMENIVKTTMIGFGWFDEIFTQQEVLNKNLVSLEKYSVKSIYSIIISENVVFTKFVQYGILFWNIRWFHGFFVTLSTKWSGRYLIFLFLLKEWKKNPFKLKDASFEIGTSKQMKDIASSSF